MLDRYQSEMQSKEIPEGVQDDREEMLNKCRSDVGRSWGKYCLLLMQRSMDKDIVKRSVSTTSQKRYTHFPRYKQNRVL